MRVKRYESGQWRIENERGGLVRIGTPDCPTLIVVGGRGAAHAHRNGVRIVTALNACEGILSGDLDRITRQWKKNGYPERSAPEEAPRMTMASLAASIHLIETAAVDAGLQPNTLGGWWEWVTEVKFIHTAGAFEPGTVDQIVGSIESLVKEYAEIRAQLAPVREAHSAESGA